MSNRDLAIRYLNAFCAGEIDELESLLADGLNFRGPFHYFGTAAEYVDSLRNDPPEKAQISILSITESEGAVAVFYEYRKPEQVMLLAQLFTFEQNKIKDILLVFDGREFVHK